MLANGLGKLLRAEAPNHDRVVDLFCGAGSVAWFVGQNCPKPVLAIDLQSYAVILAGAVIQRTSAIDRAPLEADWIRSTKIRRESMPQWEAALALDTSDLKTFTWCRRARSLCAGTQQSGVIWGAYGGHYFSPTQAVTFDAMLEALPPNEPARTVCLAAIIMAASQCAAAPGHTAQPFQPTRSAAKYLSEAWRRDPTLYAAKAMANLCPLHASVLGSSRTGDALNVARSLRSGDLVFVDPPYSDVHYSRFYHVLETLARGGCGKVTGAGRYPPISERPLSKFSRRSESCDAARKLLNSLADNRCTVIFTFPARKCSNGLGGNDVLEMATGRFRVEEKRVTTRFSTLGGNNDHRAARRPSRELILLLRPKGCG